MLVLAYVSLIVERTIIVLLKLGKVISMHAPMNFILQLLYFDDIFIL